MHDCRCPRRPETLDPLELESQATVNHLVWVGAADSDPLQALHMFNHCVISPAPKYRFLKFILHLFTVVCVCWGCESRRTLVGSVKFRLSGLAVGLTH